MPTVTHPIRELLRKDVQFNWSWEQSDAFQKVKKLLSEAPVLAFFDVKKPVTVSCDASQQVRCSSTTRLSASCIRISCSDGHRKEICMHKLKKSY